MSKKNNKTFTTRFNHIVASFFVLVIIAFPVYATARWATDVIIGTDPRSLQTLPEFNQRDADKSQSKIEPFKEPVITITFDDGWRSISASGMPIMQKYGITSTQYILGDEFSNIAYLSEDQVRDMQSHNHEIASHSLTHPNLTQLNKDDLYGEIVGSKEALEKRFDQDVADFASPLGAQNDTTIDMISQYYRSQRNTEADPETIGDEDINVTQNFDRYNIIAYTVRQSTTISDIVALTEYAQVHDGWLVLTYHQIEDVDSEYGIAPQNFEEHMKYIYDKPIRLANIGEVLNAVKEQAVVEW